MSTTSKEKITMVALARGSKQTAAGTLARSVLTFSSAPLLMVCLCLTTSPTARGQSCCLNPTSETTQQVGEDPGLPYVTDFQQTINENLDGNTVTESNGQTGSDTCHFTNSAIPSQTAFTPGPPWTVLQTYWGPDTVGWVEYNGSDPVAYYREHDRYPCMYTQYQELKLNCNPAPYVGSPGNKLTAKIDNTTQVTDCRYEELESYNNYSCLTINK